MGGEGESSLKVYDVGGFSSESSSSSSFVVEGSSSVRVVVVVVVVADVALDHLPSPFPQRGRFRIDRDWGRDGGSDEHRRGFGCCQFHDVLSVVAFFLLGLSKLERVEVLPECCVDFGVVESDDELGVGRGRLVRKRDEFGGWEEGVGERRGVEMDEGAGGRIGGRVTSVVRVVDWRSARRS